MCLGNAWFATEHTRYPVHKTGNLTACKDWGLTTKDRILLRQLILKLGTRIHCKAASGLRTSGKHPNTTMRRHRHNNPVCVSCSYNYEGSAKGHWIQSWKSWDLSKAVPRQLFHGIKPLFTSVLCLASITGGVNCLNMGSGS